MKLKDKYLEALKSFNDYVTVREWAEKFKEIYPEDFETLVKKPDNNKNDEKKSNGKNNSRSPVGILTTKINSFLRNDKDWQLCIKEDKNEKPKKVKYLKEDERKIKVLEKKAKKEKYVKFEELMRALEDVVIDDDFPCRDDEKYIKIEHMDIHNFNFSLIFMMAMGNDQVVEIIDKLNYMNDLMDEYPYLEQASDKEEDIIAMFNNEINKEYIKIAQSKFEEFKKDLEFLIDKVYSDNYVDNYWENMMDDGIDLLNVDKKIERNYKFKNPIGKTSIDKNSLTYDKLLIIENYLQDKLKNEYLIFPNGYYGSEDEASTDKLLNKNIDENFLQTIMSSEKQKDVNEAFIDFRKLKPNDLKGVADYFFIYDYYKKCKEDERLYINLDIKCLLTIHHGIEIKDIKKKITYSECLNNYDIYKDKYKEFAFYEVEETIKNKLEVMEKLIDKKYYRFFIS